MMEQVAKVVGTDSDGWVKVQVELKSACNHCSRSFPCPVLKLIQKALYCV